MVRRHRIAAACAALLLLFAARLVDSAWQNSFTVDEPHYVGLGLYLWESGDYHYASTLGFHPPLAYHLASLPWLAFDRSGLAIDRQVGRQLVHGDVFDPLLVRMLTRLPFAALTVWAAWLGFAWARELAGDRAGLLAAFLISFSPMMLAYGSIAHSDIAVTVFLLQTLYATWRYLARPTPGRAFVCGLSFGLALLSKLSAVLFLAMGPLLLAGSCAGWIRVRAAGETGAAVPAPPTAAGGWGRALRDGAIVAAVALAAVWVGWGGSFAAQPVASGPLAGWPLPGFLHALLIDDEINATGRQAFLLGEFSKGGWWYYFPVAFALKSPLGVLALLGIASFAPAARPRGLGAVMGVALGVYLGFAMFYLDVNLGLRYVLPVYPLLYVFVAARVFPADGAALRGWRRASLWMACAWIAAASLWIRPHYLAYFNEAVGGPARGPHYLLDANIDWGQSLPALADFLSEQGDPVVWLAYFGPEDPVRYGIRSQPLRGCRAVRGWVAISVNIRHSLYVAHNAFLKPNPDCYRWLDGRAPVARPGWSIEVYDLR